MEITKNEKYLELTLNNGFSYNEIINPKTKKLNLTEKQSLKKI